MIEKINEFDKEFTEATFLTKVDHIFMMILDSIMLKDMDEIKHYLSDDIYNKFCELVKTYEEAKEIRMFDETNVKSSRIINVDISDNKINITVELVSRYMDYFMDEDGNFLRGINDHRVETNHRIVFTKSIDAKKLSEVRRCPGCGNSLDINVTGICPYCQQIIDMSKYDYIVTELDLI